MASKNNSEEPFTDGAYSYPMEDLRSLVRIVSPETRRDRRYLLAVLEEGQGYTESASMAQSPSVATFVQQSHQVVQQKPDETAPLKRRKKEPGAPTKKSVVVLKRSDVTTRDGLMYMPNTIEIAKLKKKEKGQFKKMQMSSKMSETEIRQMLTTLFPYLKNKRFYCASAAHNRTRLDFHGEPRIWDGLFMKQTIRGNSALYVFVDEVTSVEETPMEVDQNQGVTTTAQGEIVSIESLLVESSTSGQQIVGSSSLQVADGNVQASDTSTPPLPRSYHHAPGMVSSTLAPQMSSLNISSAPFTQERDQSVYRALPGRQFFARLPFEQNTSPGEGNVASTEMQVVAVHSPVQPKQTSDVNAKVMSWVREVEEACLSGLQENWGESVSDYESQLTDSAADWPTDSGIEASDVFCVSDEPSGNHLETVLRDLSVPDIPPNGPCSDAFEGKQDLPSCVTDPPPQMNDKGKPDASMEGNSFDGASYDMTALVGVVQGIFPTSGSLKGGVPFQISLKEELTDEVHQATALFEGVVGVTVFKANPFNLQGFVPPSPVAGLVPVTITTDAGKQLGITCFEYIDEVRHMAKQFVNNPTLRDEWLFILSQELGFLPTRSDVTHALGPLKEVSNEDSSVKKRDQKSIQCLQQMVYLAAQAGAQHFIEIAGQIVSKSYKSRTSLPEDVAGANGHEELAQYLQDINKSSARNEDVQSFAIDWSELIMAIQKKSALKQVEPTIGPEQSSEGDDHSSDYFADAESCSCGSSDCDTDWSDTVENIVSDSKEYWVIEREPTQEQIVIEHVPAVNKSADLNKGEERESCKAQTPQRLSNSTGLRRAPFVEGTGKENCLG